MDANTDQEVNGAIGYSDNSLESSISDRDRYVENFFVDPCERGREKLNWRLWKIRN